MLVPFQFDALSLFLWLLQIVTYNLALSWAVLD